jgi:hypothetical protein
MLPLHFHFVTISVWRLQLLFGTCFLICPIWNSIQVLISARCILKLLILANIQVTSRIGFSDSSRTSWEHKQPRFSSHAYRMFELEGLKNGVTSLVLLSAVFWGWFEDKSLMLRKKRTKRGFTEIWTWLLDSVEDKLVQLLRLIRGFVLLCLLSMVQGLKFEGHAKAISLR